jgi:hypothetical protein
MNAPHSGSSTPSVKVTIQLSDKDVLDANIEMRSLPPR